MIVSGFTNASHTAATDWRIWSSVLALDGGGLLIRACCRHRSHVAHEGRGMSPQGIAGGQPASRPRLWAPVSSRIGFPQGDSMDYLEPLTLPDRAAHYRRGLVGSAGVGGRPYGLAEEAPLRTLGPLRPVSRPLRVGACTVAQAGAVPPLHAHHRRGPHGLSPLSTGAVKALGAESREPHPPGHRAGKSSGFVSVNPRVARTRKRLPQAPALKPGGTLLRRRELPQGFPIRIPSMLEKWW